MTLDHGAFIVSLDFELYWGLRDKLTIEQYKQNLLGVPNAIKEILKLFSDYDIHATWATVGFLFFKNINELISNLPTNPPQYSNSKFSPYHYINSAQELEKTFHFAPDLIELIHQHKNQEIGSHTFSHYYCLEKGQSIQTFKEDVASAIKIAANRGFQIKSIVFPRNQWNPDYLSVLRELGIACYRGNEETALYQASNNQDFGMIRRVLYLLDAYINLSGYHTYRLENCGEGILLNLHSSRFLRPYSKLLAPLEPLRLKRITSAMDDAAFHQKVFHLWWHPHNFGINTDKNMAFLKKILEHYRKLHGLYGMESLNMGELSK